MSKSSIHCDENDLFGQSEPDSLSSTSTTQPTRVQIQIENNLVDSQEFRDLYFTRPKDICTLSFGQWFSRAAIHGMSSELRDLKHAFNNTITIAEAIRMMLARQLNTQEALKRCKEYNFAWINKKPR